MDWVVLTYRLPSEPSRHRVAVWRELRRIGAVPLQQATWAVPAQGGFADAITRVVGLIERAEGNQIVFDASPRGEAAAARLEARFSEEREQEWKEFVAECAKFDAEIAHEIQIEKFTAAELDEEEQNLERLRRWFRDLKGRDLFGSASLPEAERRLKECESRLEDFAERVYQHTGETG